VVLIGYLIILSKNILYMQTRQNLSWKIGGEAGFGIKSAGMMLAKIFMKTGYETFDYTEYPSLIRGGHNTYQVMIDVLEVNSVTKSVDILVALNEETIDLHREELKSGSIVIYDQDKISKIRPQEGVVFLPITLTTMAKQLGGEVMRNVVALGATLAVLNQPRNIADQVIKETFKGKGEQVVTNNLQALAAGYKEAKKIFHEDFMCQLPLVKKNNNILIAANEALALGAVATGLNFYAGYPMTPSSTILQYLAGIAEKTGIVVKHAEDEISVINMVLGAAHVGARAMTATSGGGFALMTEALGLAGLTETPIVIVDCQRPGPATGLPTWTEQGDLQFMLHAAVGDFPKIIMSPKDINEAFFMGAEAMNLAEIYQLPVIILLDKFIAEGSSTVPAFSTRHLKIKRGKLLTQEQLNKLSKYERYKLSADGISARTLPGMKNGLYIANSDEHDAYGHSNEGAKNRQQQVDKRQLKLKSFTKLMPKPLVWGNTKAKKTVVLWGSTWGPVQDAYNSLSSKQQKDIRILQMQYLWPFASEFVTQVLRSSKKVLLIENNSNGQLGQLIAQETGIIIKDRLLKYDGRPFFREELIQALNKL
jgi:2-oxoglutarate ferredoxin oxidoreductase subunit alpha